MRLWNFAGARANNLLAKTLEGVLGEKVTSTNLSVGFREAAAQSEVVIRQAMGRLRAEGRPNRQDALAHAEGLERTRLSKFQPCLSSRLAAEYLADQLTDAVGRGQIVDHRASTQHFSGP